MNSLIASLPWPRTARMSARLQPLAITLAEVTLAELALLPIEAPSAVPAGRDEPCHSGWLDSSLDLARGLEVTEFMDRLPDELIVDDLVIDGLPIDARGWQRGCRA
jgi:hypothetical protein